MKNERLLSLDVFRGITIASMILVNTPGSWSNVYSPLLHAKWNGLTPTDLIFPFFLYIVGVAVTFSLSKKKELTNDYKKIYLSIFRRSVILFLLGLFLSAFPHFNFSTIRIPGVLQRIGVVYFFTAIIFLKTNYKQQIIISVVLLVLYWILMTMVPVPGVGYSNLEPTKNLGAWLDNLLLNGHLWRATKVWDPEGILSTIPAIASSLFGVLTGYWLQKTNEHSIKVVWMFVAGNLFLVAGYFMDLSFPINKSLWSSSYVVFTTGMALNFFGVCYWLIDVQKITFWIKPFLVFGVNAITVFFLSGILEKTLGSIKIAQELNKSISLKSYLFENTFLLWMSPINASLAWAVSVILFWLGIMWILYSKKIFIKV